MTDRARPRTWNIQKTIGRVGSPEYAASVIKREEEDLLPWANQVAIGGELSFYTGRDLIGRMALPYIQQLAQRVEPVSVLEIGGGEGKALLYLLAQLENYPGLAPVLFTMTSLTHQPEQEELKEKGVVLRIPQIAEALPQEWQESFDLVLTSALLGWVSMSETLSEIKRVLKKGGYWLAMEARHGAPMHSNSEYPEAVGWEMHKQEMKNTISPTEYLRWSKEDIFALEYKKE